jgi:hypothetical protein
MNEDINGEVEREVEIGVGRDEYLLGTVRIAFEYESCECSSEVGNQTVTEKWQEIQITEIKLLNYYYCDDEGNDIDKTISQPDREELIITAKQEFYDSDF